MTSKISSAKLLKEAVKRDGAVAILLVIGYFCYYPIGGMLLLHDSCFDSANMNSSANTVHMFGMANPFLYCVTFGAALLLGIIQFSYLHSPEKVDFYHSLPVRREKLFCIRYAAGILVWLAPFAVNLLLFAAVCAGRGVAVTEAGAAIPALLASGMVTHIACFLLVYSMTALAMLLTGKIFAAIAAVIVLCGYVPAIRLLQEVLMEFFFSTFYAAQDIGKSLAVQCTPVYAYIRICQDVMDQVFPTDLVIAITLISALICLLCLYLYRRRGSEMAGKPMAFDAIARVVKFLLVVPVTLICTVFFYAVTDNNILWEIFGWIFSLLLISGIIEFVYRMDIREAFRDKKQIILSGVVSLAILAVFQLDLLGYDRWLPEKSEVESVGLSNSHALMLYSDIGAYDQFVAKDGTVVLSWRGNVGVEQDMTLEGGSADMDALFELVEHSENFSGASVSQPDSWNYYWYRVTVTWHLKDGTEKVRSYEYTNESLVEWLSPLWETEEHRNQVNPVLNIQPEDVLAVMVAPANSWFPESVILENAEPDDAAAESRDDPETEDAAAESRDDPETEDVAVESRDDPETVQDEIKYAREAMAESSVISPEKPLTGARLEKLVETIQKDISEETLKQALSVSEWDMRILYRGGDGRVYGQTYNLNAGFADTVKLLKEYGYDLEDVG